MALSGWSTINAQWAPTARFVMFGCNTASDDKDVRVFAKDLSECSNFQNVQVWGQTDLQNLHFIQIREIVVS